MQSYIKIKNFYRENDDIDILYTSSVFRMNNPYKNTDQYYIGLINVIRGIYNLRKKTFWEKVKELL